MGDEDKTLNGLAGDESDAGESSMAEPTLGQGAAELERLVAQRTTELVTANALLKDEIAERRRVEAVLGESEARARTLLESLHVGVVLQGPRAAVITANRAALDLLGLSADQLLGKTSFDLDWNVIHEDGTPFPGATHPVPQAIETRRPVLNVVMGVFRPATRDRVWLLVDAVPQLTSDGSVEQVLCTFSDITRRKRAETAVRESEERLRLIFDGLKDYAIFLLDAEGYIASWNEGAARLKGYSEAEVIGRHFSICYTSEDVAAGKPALALKQAGAAGRHEEEGWVVRKDGTRFWADVLVTAARDEAGRLRGFVDFTRDITERRRAEESLLLFESAIEQATEAITITTPELDLPGPRIIFVNPAFTRMTGYAAEDVIGQTPRILQGPRTDRSTLDRLREKLARGEAFEGMAINYRKDGSEFYMEWRVDPIKNGRGEVTHYVAVQRDVTERVRAKEARMRLQLRLIAAQEEERRRVSRELHDQIGQYLPALMVGLKSLKQSAAAAPQAAAQAEELHDLAARIAQDIHALARDLRPAALDEFGLESALAGYAEEWAGRYGAEVDFHCNGFAERSARLPLEVETTLYRIAQEALTNIHKHAQASFVGIILNRTQAGVSLIVEDDGAGFDIEATVSAPPAERRLGLLGMRERVALVGGTIQIESAPGAGTTIVVNLPLNTKENGGAHDGQA